MRALWADLITHKDGPEEISPEQSVAVRKISLSLGLEIRTENSSESQEKDYNRGRA